MDKEKLYLEILSNMREGAYFVDTDRRISFWNKAAENITGYASGMMLGKHCQNSPLKHIDNEGTLICDSGCPLHHTLMDGKVRSHYVFLKHSSGHRISVSLNTYPVSEDGKIVGAIEIFTPSSLVIYDDELITQLANSAMNDHLTGIPNRRMTESFLDLRLREMALYKSKICAIFLDIDNFKDFNNTYGHDAGDAVLKTVSKSIMGMTRNTDLFGRWGGEEFVGIFTIKDDCDTLLIGEKLRSMIENTEIKHEKQVLTVTASIGLTIARADDTVDSVVNRADELMYQSKKGGKNRFSTDV